MASRNWALRLVGVSYLIAVAFWFTLEGSTALSYFPRYSFASNLISELGVPYMYFGGVHWMDYSPLSWLMNINFFGTACLYSLPHLLLLFVTEGVTQKDRWLRTARAVLSILFLFGLILVGVVHGGPREHKDGSIIEHMIGATFAIVGGNSCSLLAALSSGQIAPVRTNQSYRMGCMVLGVVGLISVTALVTITPASQVGTVERISVYTILAWELLTGALLLVGADEVPSKVKTG